MHLDLTFLIAACGSFSRGGHLTGHVIVNASACPPRQPVCKDIAKQMQNNGVRILAV